MAIIFVIEDHANSREFTAKLLRLEGHEVLRAANGRDALEMLESCKPDLMLLDLMMPQMDGLEFLKTMRSDRRWTELPVIMLSAVSDDAMVDQARSLGVREFLVKSRFSVADLIACVRQTVEANAPKRPEPHPEGEAHLY